MRVWSPSALLAGAIRLMAYWPMALHLSVNRRVIRFAIWLEDRRPLDRPLPWLVGLMLAALLIWLVKDVRR